MQTIYKSFKILNFESKHTLRRRPLYLCRRMPFWSWAAGTAGVVVQTSEATITGSRRNWWRANRFEDAGNSRSILCLHSGLNIFGRFDPNFFFARKCFRVSVAEYTVREPSTQDTAYQVRSCFMGFNVLKVLWQVLPSSNYIHSVSDLRTMTMKLSSLRKKFIFDHPTIIRVLFWPWNSKIGYFFW